MIHRSLQFGVKKCESLVEVIMAIFVVAMGSGVATSLIVSALQSNAFSRDNLIALNLAVEGVEAMREIRDANWLRFSYDKTTCWNMRPEVVDCLDIAAKPIAQANGFSTGGYTVDLNLTPNKYAWNLPAAPFATKLNLDSSGNDDYQLYYYDLDTTKDSDGDTKPANDHDLMASQSISLPTGVAQTGASRFYRMVTVDYIPGGVTTDQEMNVTSTVQWRTQGVKHEVVLSTKLTNYQKVKVK
ncbi:MAG: hypothetical protein U0519_03945 [Candidatus Gracilibacteria bacterium]